MMGACLAMAAAKGGRVLIEYHYFLPLTYMLTVALACFAFANFVPIVCAMEVWYTVCPKRMPMPHAHVHVRPCHVMLYVCARG